MSNMYPFITKTHNPIGGECPHRCSYCYVNGLKKRFKSVNQRYSGDPKLTHQAFLSTEKDRIFIGTMTDMFAEAIPDELIKEALSRLNDQKGTLYFQTKNPWGVLKRINSIPKHSVIIVTIESSYYHAQMGSAPTPSERSFYAKIIGEHARLQITIEPIMDFNVSIFTEMLKAVNPQQVNIGADSGRNHLPEPSAEKIRALIAELEKFTVVVKKKNLKRLLPDG